MSIYGYSYKQKEPPPFFDGVVVFSIASLVTSSLGVPPPISWTINAAFSTEVLYQEGRISCGFRNALVGSVVTAYSVAMLTLKN